MTKTTLVLGFVFGFLCFAVGYFAGRQHLRYQLRQEVHAAIGQPFSAEYSEAAKLADEAWAYGCLLSVNTSEVEYSQAHPSGFSPDLLSLGGKAATVNEPGSIDEMLIPAGLSGQEIKRGYKFTYVPGPAVSGVIKTYSLRADPSEAGVTGDKHFYTDQTGVTRFNEIREAGPDDPPVPH